MWFAVSMMESRVDHSSKIVHLYSLLVRTVSAFILSNEERSCIRILSGRDTFANLLTDSGRA